VLHGSQFYGISEASGGTSNSAPNNYPLLLLRSLDSERMRWVAPDPLAGSSAQAFTSLPIADMPSGYALATLVTNGIPSATQMIVIRTEPHSYLPLLAR
jgi:hypothetical protein